MRGDFESGAGRYRGRLLHQRVDLDDRQQHCHDDQHDDDAHRQDQDGFQQGSEEKRATLGFATLTSISLRVLAFLISGILLDWGVWIATLAVLPAAWIGLSLARRVFHRISRDALLRAVSAVLLVSGASLVLRALG